MNMNALKKIAVPLVFAGLVIMSSVSTVFAQGEIDQSNEIWGYTASRALVPQVRLGQTFIPAQDNIVGVDLVFFALTPSAENITVSVRESSGNVPESFTGKVLTSVIQSVEVTEDYPVYTTVHFDFPSRTPLTPGETYLIEVKATEGTGNIKMVASADHYPGGLLVIDEGYIIWEAAYADWGFATYYAETVTKADILKARGVPGKGIDKAPGLQKEFNPKSKAYENAGPKQHKFSLEQ
ncbi:MAG: hypothetical protein JW712_00210 [Dehalococcoidales bacterium]|nr:hypothetical protein [Dehalococcoidales bacterium]